MDNYSLEASSVSRPALKEITENAVAQQRTTTKKQSCSNLSACGDQIKENSTEVEDYKYSTVDKIDNPALLEAKNILEKHKEQTATVLPDIVNVQPILVSEEHDDSLVSSLVNNFNHLKLDSKGTPRLAIPTPVYDAISSDEEIFTECQSYSDQSIPRANDINRSIHWDTVLSNVTSSNLENIDSTTEQVESNLDLDAHQEFVIDSATQNGKNINISKLTSSECEAECTEVCSLESINATLETQGGHTNLNKTVDLKRFCREALLLSDEGSLDVTSTDVSRCNNSSYNKTNDLIETIILLPSEHDINAQKSNNNCEHFPTDDNVTSTIISDSEIVCKEIEGKQSPVDDVVLLNCIEQVNMLEKGKTEFTSSTQKDEILTEKTENSIQVESLKRSEDNNKFLPCEQNENSNQTIIIPKDEMSEIGAQDVNVPQDNSDRLPSGKNRRQLNKTIPSLQKSKYATYRIQKQTKRPDSVEESNQNTYKNDEVLNNTFALCSEPDIDTPMADKTFDAIQLNGTFDATTSHPALNETIEIASSGVDGVVEVISLNDKDLNVAMSTSLNDKDLNVDMSKTIVVNKIERNDDFFEPMDIDVDSPKKNELVPTKNISSSERVSTTQEVFMENLTNAMNVTFKAPSTAASIGKRRSLDHPSDNEFEGHGIILNPSDFDFLLTKGGNSVQVDDRNSLLLRFDPLVGHSVPVNQPQINNQNQISTLVSPQQLGRLSPAVEEDEESHNPIYKENSAQSSAKERKCHVMNEFNSDFIQEQVTLPKGKNIKIEKVSSDRKSPLLARRSQILSAKIKNDDKMSADVIQGLKIENDSKSEQNLSPKSEEKGEYKMDDLEKKIKNEVLKTEDIEKKLKDAEQREEALLKRITEKDKTISKMSGVIEAYEKAIAELIAEKEQIIQNYEKQMSEIKSERDRNYQHLTSLETTFSDLHVKYERSKQLTAKLKSSEEDLKAEKKQNLENLRLQEQRYEKMKNHAIQQLEIANNKLESLSKNHTMEVTRLKALLKKEELSRLSINEQLQQKTRENEELMKICDELINSQGASS